MRVRGVFTWATDLLGVASGHGRTFFPDVRRRHRVGHDRATIRLSFLWPFDRRTAEFTYLDSFGMNSEYGVTRTNGF